MSLAKYLARYVDDCFQEVKDHSWVSTQDFQPSIFFQFSIQNQISAIRVYRIGLNTDFSSVKVMVLRSLV